MNYEDIAEAVLKAAGSGFKHYMPATKEKIIEAVKLEISKQKKNFCPVCDENIEGGNEYIMADGGLCHEWCKNELESNQ